MELQYEMRWQHRSRCTPLYAAFEFQFDPTLTYWRLNAAKSVTISKRPSLRVISSLIKTGATSDALRRNNTVLPGVCQHMERAANPGKIVALYAANSLLYCSPFRVRSRFPSPLRMLL